MVQDLMPASTTLLRLRHHTVASVTGDIEALRFNTAIARLMEMANGLTVASVRPTGGGRDVRQATCPVRAAFGRRAVEQVGLRRHLGIRILAEFRPSNDAT